MEGSTKLLHALGADSYAPALAEHRRILRQASSAHGGVEVDTQGDAFFFAFPTAESAAELLATVEEVDRIARPGAPARRRPEGPPADEDIASADVLVLTDRYDAWTEPKASARDGPDAPNAVVRERFGLRAMHGAYAIYTRR